VNVVDKIKKGESVEKPDKAVVRYAAGHVVLGAVAAVIGLTAASSLRAEEAHRPPLLNTLRDVGLALEVCWRVNEPPLAQARPGMNVTVMLTFTRSGALQGEPRFTYVTPEASPETKALYERAAVAAINACTPLPFSEALGNALAGIPKVMPFIDRRNQKEA
jgi:hypothetical protein